MSRRTWVQFAVFLVVDLAIHAGYGRRHSTLAGTAPEVMPTAAAEREPQAV